MRMQNGDIGLFYLKKMQYGAAVIDAYMLSRSSDEGKTWSEPVECLNDLDYYVVNNDRVVRLQNGSILIPVAQHSQVSRLSPRCAFSGPRMTDILSGKPAEAFIPRLTVSRSVYRNPASTSLRTADSGHGSVPISDTSMNPSPMTTV